VSVWGGPREVRVSRGRDPDAPSFEIAHPLEAAGALDRRVEHLAWGGMISHDARAGAQHWSRGWRGSLAAERYGRAVEALALSDAHAGAPTFTRLSARLEGGVSFGRDPRTLRLALEAVDQEIDRGAGALMPGDLASLGGGRLAGYEPDRFRDLDLGLAKLSYLYPLVKNLEFDLHAEAGSVFPRLAAARLDDVRHSFGVALRLRSDFAMLGAVGVDWSPEQARLRFSIGGVE
jgi:hypothetical protein